MSSGFVVWPLVGVLGALGALARYALDTAVEAQSAGRFPLGTLAVNLSGTFAMGLTRGLGLTGDAELLAGAAALGSYTTFSTVVLESERLLEDGDRRAAAANVALSMVLGLGAAAAGWALGRAA